MKIINEVLKEAVQTIQLDHIRKFKKLGQSADQIEAFFANMNDTNKAAFAKQTFQLYTKTIQLLEESAK